MILKRLHAEVIFSPTGPGAIENDISEKFLLLSKMREDQGGLALSMIYEDPGQIGSSFARAFFELRDAYGNYESLTSGTYLLYESVYFVDGYIDTYLGKKGLLIYLLTDRGWALQEDLIETTDLDGVGSNEELVSVGHEVKRFFVPEGEWVRHDLVGRRFLYRFAPASQEARAGAPTLHIVNEMFPGESLTLSDSLASHDTPYNATSTNLGAGVISDAGAFDPLEGTTGNLGGTPRYVEVAPFTKRHASQPVVAEDQHIPGSYDSDDYESVVDQFDLTSGTSLGPGPFIKDLGEPRATLHDATKITILGFVKPEPNARTPSQIGGLEFQEGDYNAFQDGPEGVTGIGYGNPVGIDFASNRSFYGDGDDVVGGTLDGYYNVFAPQDWTTVDAGALWVPQTILNVGQDYLDYPSFRHVVSGQLIPSYGATHASSDISFFRTIFSNSNNGGLLSFGRDMRWGHRWIGLGLISTFDASGDMAFDTSSVPFNYLTSFYGWEDARALSVANSKEELLRDQRRLDLDRSIYGLRRFLVAKSRSMGLQVTQEDDQRFEGATWPFERIRFSKIFRCAFQQDRFIPWTGETLVGGKNELPGFDSWVNNTPSDLEGFCFMHMHQAPPTQGIVVGLDTPSRTPRSSMTPRDLLSGSLPETGLDSGFRSIASPSLLVCMYTTLEGTSGRSSGDDRVDHVFQTLQLSAVPQYAMESPWDSSENNWEGKYHPTSPTEDSGAYFRSGIWQFYCLSIDLENQRAYVGWAPVPSAGVADDTAPPSLSRLSTMFDTTGWSNQVGLYVLGHDAAKEVTALESGKSFAGPDWGLIARVFNYGVEYDLRFMDPEGQPVAGQSRKRILLGASSAVTAGLKIWNPQSIEGIEAKTALMSMLDPGYVPKSGTENSLDDECPIPNATTQKHSNILTDLYPKDTTWGSCTDGHENALLRGKIGEHLLLEGVYTNGDGQQVSWPSHGTSSADYVSSPESVGSDIVLEANPNAVSILDLVPQIQAGVMPNDNWRYITEPQSACAVASVRLHKENVLDSDGKIADDKTPANIPILGTQPHYDLDTESVKPRDAIVVHEQPLYSDSAPSLAYEFGALYEPPIGTIVHGSGHIVTVSDAFIAAIPQYKPLCYALNYSIGANRTGNKMGIDHTPSSIAAKLTEIWDAGMIPNVGITLDDSNSKIPTNLYGRDKSEGLDILYCLNDVAPSLAAHFTPDGELSLDDQVMAMAQGLAEYGNPLYLRVGFEISNGTGYHPYWYRMMFKKLYDVFESQRTAPYPYAYMYTLEANGSFFLDYQGSTLDYNAYLPDAWSIIMGDSVPGLAVPTTDNRDNWKDVSEDASLLSNAWFSLGVNPWYPGDDFIDWFGVDMFQLGSVSPPASGYFLGASAAKSLDIVSYAKNVKSMPVCLPEVHPASDTNNGYPGNQSGLALWNKWYSHFFYTFLPSYPQVKLINYTQERWFDTTDELYTNPLFGWLDSRLIREKDETYGSPPESFLEGTATNAELLSLWQDEMSGSRWLHTGSRNSLNKISG